MAAADYATLRTSLKGSRLLFVAHREEILKQSLSTFRHVLRDGAFGELWVAGQRPERFDHVFASIQSVLANGLTTLGNHSASHFDVVIIELEPHQTQPPRPMKASLPDSSLKSSWVNLLRPLSGLTVYRFSSGLAIA